MSLWRLIKQPVETYDIFYNYSDKIYNDTICIIYDISDTWVN